MFGWSFYVYFRQPMHVGAQGLYLSLYVVITQSRNGLYLLTQHEYYIIKAHEWAWKARACNKKKKKRNSKPTQ